MSPAGARRSRWWPRPAPSCVDVEGDGFLYNQVRNMVGTLALVGKGRWRPQEVRKALEARDRRAAGVTAPAAGLYLTRVTYD